MCLMSAKAYKKAGVRNKRGISIVNLFQKIVS